MAYIDQLQAEDNPTPIVETVKPKRHPLLEAMQELKEEGIVEAKESIKDQIEKAVIVDGGSIDDYFVRHTGIDKLGYSSNQSFGRSPDIDHPSYSIDYIGRNKGSPALWFYPLRYYLQADAPYAADNPYVWLVKLKPNAWLQPVDDSTTAKQDAPNGKERVGILRKTKLSPSAIFFKPGFDVVDRFYDYGSQHKRHGEVKGAPVEEEIAYHGTVDDINEFHPFTHFGTEKAAKDRMEYKKIKDGKIYKVDLDIKNPLHIKDFPGIHYDRQYAFELRDKGLISQEEMEAITFIQDKQKLRKALLNKLSELGIDGFVYKNKYEDKGNISYVIVDPNQVKVLGVEPANEVAETISTGQGGGSAGNGGAQMVGGPTTYEEEYGMFKSKGPRRITAMTNEALDSSYEYVLGQKPGVFYFETEDGNEYKVDFSGNNKKTEVAFAQRGQGDEHKTGLTGTGNSRKIFGTVINIVKDYMSKAKPDMLIFNANNSEPSRVRLYKMLANQADSALPDYNFAKALSDGSFTTYYLTRNGVKVPVTDKIKAAGFKGLDKVFENYETTSLDKIYHGMRPDHDEMIWNYVGDSDFDTEFPIETINPTKLGLYLRSQYSVEDLEELFDMMDDDQEILVNHYMKEPNLSNEIVVMYDGKVVDGNHRALAAALTNKPIRYIDIGEEDESS